jgi:formylglycine-generating enzyme
MVKNNLILITAALLVLTSFSSCKKKDSSTATGWGYNDKNWGGFEVTRGRPQVTGPNLVYIPGGTFTMGQTEQDVTYEADNMPRRVTVSSFYMDETEVTNLHYLEYLHWIQMVFVDYPQVYEQSLPDTFVWRDPLAYNEPMVRFYFRHPAYQEYPVVGVNWVQASRYAEWRGDRVNEMLLVREGITRPTQGQTNESNFNTEAYLAGLYEPETRKPIKTPSGDFRTARIEDGILLPEYRLPTEAEWEYAALSLAGTAVFENVNTGKLYPWTGKSMRQENGKYRGKMMANHQRGRGDLMGVASSLNDQAAIPAHVRSYWPNDFGLYNMAGNVSEWVMDVYRPLSLEDFTEFNPFRGNEFRTQVRDMDGYIDDVDSLGRIRYRDVTVEENINRRNYKRADYRGHLDPMTFNQGGQGYEYGVSSLINDNVRVYKGGSWRDKAYYMSPGARRFLDENQATATIGFRCAMIRVGNSPGFKQKK